MESKITYMRYGHLHSTRIETRLAPNLLAVKFVVIEHELGHNKESVPQDDHHLLDELLEIMGIEILDVSPAGDSDKPKPYDHRV